MISRAFIQCYEEGKLGEQSSLASIELQTRGIPSIFMSLEAFQAFTMSPAPLAKLSCTDLVVGDFQYIRLALLGLGIKFPSAPDFPVCLEYLLYRRTFVSTLGELKDMIIKDPKAEVFFKPLEETKAFSGDLATLDWINFLLFDQHIPSDFALVCSDRVDMLCEYRAYVVEGKVRALCRYRGPHDIVPDRGIIEGAAADLFASEEGRALVGCSIDFAVVQLADGSRVTALIEVNEGFALGAYEGLSGKDFVDLLCARWVYLTKQGR
jgi:hypothetical protein